MPTPMRIYNAVFYNRSIYYFGNKRTNLSFDLDENKWSKFAGAPLDNFEIYSSIAFNGNIIISWKEYSYLILYSIDIDSFSKIPYDFEYKWYCKSLLNAGERLYVINCPRECRIYESEVGNVYSWNNIALHSINADKNFYCSYNKGAIYISEIEFNKRKYFKFDLLSKSYTEIACYNNDFALKMSNNVIEVIECHSQTFKLDPDLLATYIDNGYELYFISEMLEKIEHLSINIINETDNIPKLYYLKAKSLHRISRNLEALECLNEIIKLDPELTIKDVSLTIGKVLHDLGRYLEAIEYYNKQLKLKPHEWEPHFRKALSLCELGMYLEAIGNYKEAIKFEKYANNDNYFRIGYALYNLGRNNEAMKCYNKATAEDYYSYYYLLNRGNLLNDLGEDAKALHDCKRAYDEFSRNYHRINKFLQESSLELLRAFANLQESIIDVKDKLKIMKDKKLKRELFKEYEMKWQTFKIEHSKLLQRAVKCFDPYRIQSVKKMEQMKKEVEKFRWAVKVFHSSIMASPYIIRIK